VDRRLGTPDDFRFLVDTLCLDRIGVLKLLKIVYEIER